MKKKIISARNILSLLLALFLSPGLHAQLEKPSVDTSLKYKTTFFPAISYTPETSVALGASAMRLFSIDKSMRSQINTTLLYTFKNQFLIESIARLHFNQDKLMANAKLDFSKYPENYYGVGNNTDEDARKLISYHVVRLEGSVMKRIRKNLYVGPKLFFTNYYNLSGETEFKDETGSKGGITTGLGLNITYDSRDHSILATKGFYADISSVWNGRVFGGSFNYSAYEADLRKYFSFGENTTIALQASAQVKTGDIPILQLSYLGGSNLMRGYYAGRYRDNDLVAAQLEVRQQLSRKWGFVLFGGYGEVMDSFQHFTLNELHPSFGGGLRRSLSKTEKINLRMDMGIANGKTNFYVNISEAF